MAGNVSKWRLNKTETKQLDDETKAFYDAQIAAGMDKQDAQKERDNFYDKRSKELKSLKAAKSASKKAEQKKGAPEVEVAGKDDVAMGPDFNSDYFNFNRKPRRSSWTTPSSAGSRLRHRFQLKRATAECRQEIIGLAWFSLNLAWCGSHCLVNFINRLGTLLIGHCSLTFTYLIFRRKKE